MLCNDFACFFMGLNGFQCFRLNVCRRARWSRCATSLGRALAGKGSIYQYIDVHGGVYQQRGMLVNYGVCVCVLYGLKKFGVLWVLLDDFGCFWMILGASG